MAVTNRPIDGKLVCNASPGLDSGLIELLEHNRNKYVFSEDLPWVMNRAGFAGG